MMYIIPLLWQPGPRGRNPGFYVLREAAIKARLCGMGNTGNTNVITECADIVRRGDPDRFLLTLFFAPALRAGLWPLYAFNHEIARTREVVTNTHIGLIRLQWWRDAIAALYEGGPAQRHSVIEGLDAAIRRHGLNREWFDRMLYAREYDLEDSVPGSLEGLCNYADFTHTPLLRLGAAVTGEDPEHEAIQPVAIAYALIGLLRAVPFHRAQGMNFMPEGITPAEIRVRAQDFLRQAEGGTGGKLTRLHARMARQYINRIKVLNDDIEDIRLGVPPLFRQVGLWRAARKK